MKNKLLLIIAVIISISILPFPLSCKSDTSQTVDNVTPRIVQTENTDLSPIVQNIIPVVVDMVFVANQTDRTPTTLGNGFLSILGSGFILNGDGYVIMPAHVLDLGEQMIQTQQIPNKKLAIAIGPIPYLLPDRPDFPLSTNDFDVVARDNKHDLALLKIRMILETNPLNGVERYYVNYTQYGGTPPGGDANFTADILQGMPVGVVGLFINQTVQQTTVQTVLGTVTSKELSTVLNSNIVASSGSVKYNVTNYYNSDVLSNTVTSGSPVFSTKDGALLGMAINVIQNQNNTGTTVIIPGQYITDLLNSAHPNP